MYNLSAGKKDPGDSFILILVAVICLGAIVAFLLFGK